MIKAHDSYSTVFLLNPVRALSVLILASLLSLVNTSMAASIPDQISFQNILENKDIAMGEGATVFQDSQGFMWLGGSTALFRYDGYEFKQILISVNDNPKDNEPVAYVSTVFEDSRRMIWVGTAAGLLQYDPRTEKLVRLKDDESQTQKISTTGIVRMAEMPTGEILGCSLNGLYIINMESLKYTVITADAQKPDGLRSAKINSVYLEGQNDVWLATDAGLEQMDWQAKTFKFHKINADFPNSLPDARSLDVVSDKEGKFWVATAHGLIHYDPKTGQAKRYLKDPADRFSLSGNDLWKLMFDSQGVLWAGSDGGGVSVYNKEKDHFINHKAEPGRLGSISSSVVRTIYEDRNGDVWVGNYPGGFNFFDRSSGPIVSYSRDVTNPKSLSHSRVLGVAEDKVGNLWLATDTGGLNYFDREKGEFSHFMPDPKDPNSLCGDSVLNVLMDSTGLIWTGSWSGGVCSYNPADKKFTHYPFAAETKASARITTSAKLTSETVWNIREDRQQQLWFAMNAGGVSKYDRTTKMFTHYSNVEGDADSLTAGRIWTTFEDSKGNVWVGAAAGLNLLDQEQGTVKVFVNNPADPTSISSASVLTIFEDSKNRLWIGTQAGLNLFNPDTKTFTSYTKKDGFLNDVIRTIVEDSDGILWISTDNGFASFNPETQKIKTYNRLSGRLLGDFAYRSGLFSSRGEVILGGTNGLRIIKPKELSENKNPPPVVFTDFKLFADTVSVGANDGLLKESVNNTEQIELDYTQSMFTFGFAGLNYRDTGKNNYAYKLEGFDKDWLAVGTQRSAKYTNLNAGTYVFKVKASNNDGVWNDAGKAITIVQLPAPWKTWWAYTLYTLIVLGIIVQFVQSQRRKRRLIEEQNRILELKVSERTAELRVKNKDIQAMLGNMRQGLFTIEPNGNIHPEYSKFLEEIFETKEVAGCNVLDVLFGKAHLGSDTFDQVKEAIKSIIGEDEMNFEFNSHLLLQEYEAEFDGQLKYLSLTWNPILSDDVVDKLMVSVRDVTQLKQMEAEAQSKKRELDIISQLLNVPAKKYLSFAESAKRFVAENREKIQDATQYSEAVVALLFRNMHTIKGNCRTFGFNHFSNVVHEVESVYSAIKKSEEPQWEKDKLLSDLELVDQVLSEYELVYYTVLGRGDTTSSRDQNGFWADSKAIQTIQTCIEKINLEFPAIREARELLPIQAMLEHALSSPVREVLADVVESLGSIAIQFDKEAPEVNIHADKVRIKSSANELMGNIFAHILRNCVDHGLESAAQRLAAGKPAKGTIDIRSEWQNDQLQLHIKDDGQGINIDRLLKRGRDMGKWQAQEQPSYQEIADLIFVSGVSTKEEVTDISGRGVGMDAVKSFLLAQGGSISLHLLGDSAGDNRLDAGIMVPFELVVTLPAGTYSVSV